MKKILCVLLLVCGGCYKPIMLQGEDNATLSEYCIQLSADTQKKLPIYRITGGHDDVHNYNDHNYYYFLSDYIDTSCKNHSNIVLIKQSQVGAVFNTAGKGRSYLKLVFEVKVDFSTKEQSFKDQVFKAESYTGSRSFTASRDEIERLVSKALSKGYQDILIQIETVISEKTGG